MKNLQKDENGNWFYKEKPENTRVAELIDFYYDEELLIEKPYLIHSEANPGIYWAFRVKRNFREHNDFMVFLERGRVFVFEQDMPIDYKKYSSDWKLRSKFIRFYRAKNKCEFCGAKNYKPHPITGSKVILTVAHLDHDINNGQVYEQ